VRHGRGQRLQLGIVVGRGDVAALAAGAPQERVPTHGEEPPARVGVRPKGVPPAERLQIRLLHEVVGALRVAGERPREPPHVGKPRQGEAFELTPVRPVGARVGRRRPGRPSSAMREHRRELVARTRSPGLALT
jgi:hypothetical protein